MYLCLYFICTCICICICFCICLIVTSSACKFIVLPMIISYQPPISKGAKVEHLLKSQIYKNKKKIFLTKVFDWLYNFLLATLELEQPTVVNICWSHHLSLCLMWWSECKLNLNVVNVYMKSDVMNSITVLLGFFGFK